MSERRTVSHGRKLLVLSEQDVARFWSKVDICGEDDCWPWLAGSANKSGDDSYGAFWAAGTNLRAHRVAFELAKGSAAGMLVCHSCDHPPCCNPKHHFVGTVNDNNQDKKRKGRAHGGAGDRHWSKTHPHLVPHGSASHRAKLVEEQVREIRRRRAAGESQRAIAAAFNVSRRTITFIEQGKTWKHIL